MGFQLEQAMGVCVGDAMITSDGKKGAVTSTRGFLSGEKWILETAEGTALLNDIQTTTICEENLDVLPKDYDTAMHTWQESHAARRQLDPEHIKWSSEFTSKLRSYDEDGDGKASLREVVKAAFSDAFPEQTQRMPSHDELFALIDPQGKVKHAHLVAGSAPPP